MRIRLHYAVEIVLAVITLFSFIFLDGIFNTVLSSPISELAPFETLTLLVASVFSCLLISESITRKRNGFSMNLVQFALSLTLPVLLIVSVLPISVPSIGLSAISVLVVSVLTYIRNKTAFEDEYKRQHRFSFNASIEIALISPLPLALIIWCLTSPLSLSQLFSAPLMIVLFILSSVSLIVSTLYRVFSDSFEYTRNEIAYLFCIGICIGVVIGIGGIVVSHPGAFLLFNIVIIAAIVQRVKQITTVTTPSS